MFTISPGMRLVPVGTSLTAGGLATGQPRGWWNDLFGINGPMFVGPQLGSINQFVSPGASNGLHRASTNPPYAAHYPSLAEIGGAKMSDLLAIWDSTLVGPFLPVDGYILEGNINDVNAATNPTTFRAQVTNMLARTGTKPVIWLAAVLGFIGTGESPSTFGNAFNLSIDSYNTIVSEECASAGSRVTFVNARPTAKAWEVANNGGDLGSGLLTTDGVHLKEAGIGIVTQFARSFVQWSS